MLKRFWQSFYTKDRNVNYLFLGALCLEFTPVLLSTILLLTKKPVSVLIEGVLSILLFAAMLFFTFTYLVKKESGDVETGKKASLLQGVLSGFTVYVLVSVVMMGIFFLLKEGYQWMGTAITSKSLLYIPVLLALLLATVLGGFLIYTGILQMVGSIRYRIPQSRQLRTFLYLLGVTVKNFIYVALTLVAALLICGILLFLMPYFNSLLQSSISTALLRLVIQVIALSAAEAYLIYFLLNTAEQLVDKYKAGLEKIAAGKGQAQPAPDAGEAVGGKRPAFGIPALTIFLMAALAVLWFFSFTQSSNPFDEYEKLIAAGEMQAEMYYGMQMTDIAAIKYRQSYSMALAVEGYIRGLIVQNPSAIDADRAEVGDYRANMNSAYEYDRSSTWISVFRGYLENNSGNFQGGVTQFKYALQGTEPIPDIYVGILNSYDQMKDKDNIAKTLELLVQKQIFRGNLSETSDYKIEKLKKQLDRFVTIRKSLFESLALNAMEKMKYNDFQGMFTDIQQMLQAEPDNKSLLYLYGIAAMSYRTEGSNYPVANTAYDRLLEVSGGSEDASVLKAYMSLLTKDNEKAKVMLKDLYERNPDFIGLGEQYAYSLLLTGGGQEAVTVADEILKKDPDSWFAAYVKSIAELKLKQYDNSLTDIAKTLEITKKLKLDSFHDQYLYAYTMTYSISTREPECMAALDKLDKSGLLYNYISGTTAWRDKDHDKAEQQIQKVIELDKNLGYAKYLMGITLYERSMKKSSNEFDKAEKFLLASLDIIPEHTTGWFALAHNYKKWGGHEVEALRAFRKVVDLEPYSDHTRDYYGMTIHAQGEISALQQYESQGVK